MDNYLLWAITGFVLIIAELTTGTFYLLVLGLAAFVGAAAAWFGASFWVQVLATTVPAVGGVMFVRAWLARRPKQAQSANDLEIGQTVVLDEWINEAAGMARVRYRGTIWNAKVESPAAVNDTLTIRATANGVLHVGNPQSPKG